MQINLGSPVDIGFFTYSWPEYPEEFSRGWKIDAVIDGVRRATIRHGIGKRTVYGRPRVHSVTFVDGQPRVEGVEADDYSDSQALLSRVKRADNKTARFLDQVPPEVRGFPLVDHRSEIDAPFSPRCLAVKIVEDNVVSWARFALLRARLLRYL
jgi:hypothetical protein